MSEFRRQTAATLAFLLLHFSMVLAGWQASPPADAQPDVNATVRLQVLLDRAGFSPGQVDGQGGANTDRALEAYRAAHGLPDDADAQAVAKALAGADDAAVLQTHVISADEADGPFTAEIPDDLMAQAELPALHYRDVVEALGEQFHVAPELLRRLNPDASFEAGETIRVPNVRPHPPVGEKGGTDGEPARPAADVEVTVSKGTSSLTVRRNGEVVLHAPATTGSTHDPLPLGEWTVTTVSPHPSFHYNPDLFWDSEPSDARAIVPPGPNGPVGVVWIDLSKEHYGIHGTSEPASIGHTSSHGCVRLTNWDAARLAALVTEGTPVHFVE